MKVCDSEDLRQFLRSVQEMDNIGLRELGERTGVSFSTLGRFIRGETLGFKTFQKLINFREGKPPQLSKPRMIRRFKVGKSTFIVEIHEVIE